MESEAEMKRFILLAVIIMIVPTLTPAENSPVAPGMTGEAVFKEHCAACHAGGGNTIKADKTLSREDRKKHGIKTAMDIVRLMRKPGEGMTVFDKKTISDKEAQAVAAYIIKTFK